MYPGSFDPLHLGHVDVIAQASEMFGEVIVAVMYNHSKTSGLFAVDQRIQLAQDALAHLDGVTVIAQTGLAVQAAQRTGVDFIVKGLRNSEDFEIEQQMAHNNYAVTGVRTVYLPCAPGPLVSFSEKIQNSEREIKSFLRTKMYQNNSVLKKNQKGKVIVKKLFNIIKLNPRKFISKDHLTNDKYRAISDFISGMTDRFAINLYNNFK